MEFWGVEVKSGQPLKVKPEFGKLIYISQAALGECKEGAKSVPLKLKIDDEDFIIGILSAEDRPQVLFDLVFEREFELSHDWKGGSVYFIGYLADEPASGDKDFSNEFKDDLGVMENDNIEPISGDVNPAKIAAAAEGLNSHSSDEDSDGSESSSDDEMSLDGIGEEDSTDLSSDEKGPSYETILPQDKTGDSWGLMRGPDGSLRLILPKLVLSLPEEEKARFKSLFVTPENENTPNLSIEEDRVELASLWTNFSIKFVSLLNAFGRSEERVAELEAAATKRNEEVAKLQQELKEVKESHEAVAINTEQWIAALQGKVASLSSELDKSEKNLSDLVAHYQGRKEQIREEGKVEGIELCKRRLFFTDVGQSFLERLHEGWCGAYLKSSIQGPIDASADWALWLPAVQESINALVRAPTPSPELRASANPLFNLQVP